MLRSVRDARTNEELPVQNGELRWRPEGAPPLRFRLFVPHLVQGIEIGGEDTGVCIYPSGYINWPGRECPRFDNHLDAQRYVEATYILENSDG